MAHELTDRVIRVSLTFGPDDLYAYSPGDFLMIGGIAHVALKVGDRFTLCPLSHSEDDHDDKYQIYDDRLGFAYRPIDPSMTADDIEGATYPHDTGTHWLFAHCSPGEQIDFAAEARTYATQQFAMAIAKAQVKADEATNATLKARAVAKVSALVDFAEAVGASAYATVVGATLGHYHRDPHHDHKRDLAVDAIAAALADWKKRALTDTAIATARSHVTTDAAAVSTALTETHTIEWRHERAAREEAAKKAREAAAEAETETSSGTETPQGD